MSLPRVLPAFVSLLSVALVSTPADAATPNAPTAADAPRESRRLTPAEYSRRGTNYLARPRPEDQLEAERLFRKALDGDPDLVEAHTGLARLSIYLYTLGIDETPERLETALEEARRAVDRAPDGASARAALALARATDDRLTPALDEARRAVALDASSADAQVALGIVLRLRRETEASLAACRRAAALAPDEPRVLVALADSLRESERFSEAIEMYGQAIDLDH
ncbi:MAG TPA: tetratricopeptide repeat protein, partial [Candidatus Polarisedimenticolia bacterium]|nr:tetratricopeptide repeat protein [Candidatus Polarisedimenticolia bacterium]